jgi:hypothetical protein
VVLRTKPQFVWNKQDMLWIMHDDAGNPVFAMNRAYSLSIGNAGSASYLLEAIDAYQDSANGPQFSYTRAVDTNPTIIASDPDGGVLYQVHWPSSLSEGDGGIILTRNIILYCDADHGWHFLLEGPTTARGIHGAYEYFSQCLLVEAARIGHVFKHVGHHQPYVRQGYLGMDITMPDQGLSIRLRLTLLSTDNWEVTGSRPNGVDTQSMTVRQRLVPATDSDNASPVPVFKPQGPHFVIVSKAQTLPEFIDGLSNCSDCDEFDDVDTPAGVQNIATILRQANPTLTDKLTVGEKIVVPDQLFGIYPGDPSP